MQIIQVLCILPSGTEKINSVDAETGLLYDIDTFELWNRKEKEKVDNLYIIAKKIIDVRPTILKAINCKNYRKSPGLFKIAERLNVKIKGEQHNALNDAVLLYGVCRELNIQMSI